MAKRLYEQDWIDDLTDVYEHALASLTRHSGTLRRKKSMARCFTNLCKIFLKHGYSAGVINTHSTIYGIYTRLSSAKIPGAKYKGQYTKQAFYEYIRAYASCGLVAPYEHGEAITLLIPSSLVGTRSARDASATLRDARIARANMAAQQQAKAEVTADTDEEPSTTVDISARLDNTLDSLW